MRYADVREGVSHMLTKVGDWKTSIYYMDDPTVQFSFSCWGGDPVQ